MMEIVELYGVAAGTVALALTLLWAVSVVIRDASIIDIFWGFGLVLCNFVTLALGDDHIAPRQWLVHALVTLWGLRLSIHLLIRNAGTGEDPRYRKWREEGGPNWWIATWYRIYLLQGAILLVVAAPVIVVNQDSPQPPLGWLDFIGVLVWLGGFLFEVIGDQQLVNFKRDPENQGKVMDRGLWRYTVHPNYFGDATQWWGLWLIVAGAPGGFWTFVGPLLMTLVFIRVSNGVLERALSRKRPGYDDYILRTSRFVPMPPKSNRRDTGR
ncbi:MAG: DUF1295 domain-containing protein [Pseudomonadales bacterium]|nr:DUF1295 domain-containing protein [Pseudomonadales bacterium]